MSNTINSHVTIKDIIHVIWCGKVLPQKFRKNVHDLAVIALLAKGKLIFWTDSVAKQEAILEDILPFRSPRVSVRHISTLDQGTLRHFQEEDAKSKKKVSLGLKIVSFRDQELVGQKYATLSDLVRIEAVRQKSGLYMDVDNLVCTKYHKLLITFRKVFIATYALRASLKNGSEIVPVTHATIFREYIALKKACRKRCESFEDALDPFVTEQAKKLATWCVQTDKIQFERIEDLILPLINFLSLNEPLQPLKDVHSAEGILANMHVNPKEPLFPGTDFEDIMTDSSISGGNNDLFAASRAHPVLKFALTEWLRAQEKQQGLQAKSAPQSPFVPTLRDLRRNMKEVVNQVTSAIQKADEAAQGAYGAFVTASLRDATIDLGPQVLISAFTLWHEARRKEKSPQPDYEKIGLTISNKEKAEETKLLKLGNQTFYSYCEGTWQAPTQVSKPSVEKQIVTYHEI
jgi:hypothetical protein